MLPLQPRGALQDGLFVVLGGSQEPKHPKHKLALAAVQNQRNRHCEFETKNIETPSAELPTKTVKAVTRDKL